MSIPVLSRRQCLTSIGLSCMCIYDKYISQIKLQDQGQGSHVYFSDYLMTSELIYYSKTNLEYKHEN